MSLLQQDPSGSTCPQRDPIDRMIDPDGDLCLQIGENRCNTFLPNHSHETITNFTVCSRSFARASPVFRRLLQGGLSEAKRPVSNSQWTVKLPKDNIEAMELLLNIIHCNFHNVPRKYASSSGSSALQCLYQLAIVTDKYDCTRLLQPWVSTWVHETPYSTTDPVSLQKWSWIAWVFGEPHRFGNTLLDMSRIYSAKQRSRLFLSFSTEDPEPHAFWDTIKARRLKMIEKNLGPYQEAINDLRSGELKARRFRCDAGHYSRKDDCMALRLGYLIQALTSADLYPIPLSESVSCSLSELELKLTKLNVGGFISKDHKLCDIGPKMTCIRTSEVADDSSPITEQQKQSLARRAERLGRVDWQHVVPGESGKLGLNT